MREKSGSFNTIDTDVLIIGGGIAACLAAIEAKRKGVSVTIVDKANIGRSGNSPLMSGILTMFDPDEDDYENWFRHCVETGQYVNEQDILKQVIEGTTKVVRELESWGVEFIKKDGKLERYESMAGSPNVKMTRGGIQMMDVVRGEVIRRGVRLVQRVMVVDLLTSDGNLPTQGKVVGALGFDIRNGEPYVFKAKATVIATGSVALRRYKCLSPFVLSADGIMAAYRCGCQLKNLELTLASYSPADFNIAPGAHLILGYGAYLISGNGDRFMVRYEPIRMEKAPRTITAVAIAKEYLEGRGPIWLDARHLDSKAHDAIRRGIPIYMRTLERAGLDLAKDRIQYKNSVSPCMGAGGIRINVKRATTVEGLYAAGSCGDHAEDGADNAMGNGIESAVSGMIAGGSAAEFAQQADEPTIDKGQVTALREGLLKTLENPAGISAKDVADDLGRTWESIEVIRSEKTLNNAVRVIEKIINEDVPKVGAEDYHILAEVKGVSNKALFLELLCRCALARSESRGGHYRIDYPERDDENWLKWVICQKKDNQVHVWSEPIPFDRYPLKPPISRV
jgi:succinate dehydrogenase / fumarate reductase flavoprotein subunit